MTKKLGRPSVLSRDMILSAALDLAAANPANAISLSSIARHMNVTPMAMYRYFASRDELMQAMSGRLLAGLEIELAEGHHPIETIVLWAHAVRRHFLRFPELINMLAWEGGHSSVAWINQSDPVFEALAGLGVDDDDLPRVILWIWNGVTSSIRFELYDRQMPATMTDTELAGLDASLRTRFERVLNFMSGEVRHDRLFEFQLERLADGLRAIARK